METSAPQTDSSKMVEKASGGYHVTFKAVQPVGLLNSLAPFINADITNPRELYSMLSESKLKGALLTSVTVNSHAGAKLPPLQSSSEVQFRSLGEQTQHSSYPDLVSFRRQHGASSQQDTMRRSTSLQDVSSLEDIDAALKSKKLKPILRGNGAKNAAGEQPEKGGVKFGQKEVHLIKNPPLPPIEGVGGQPSSRGTLSFNAGAKNGEDWTLSLGPSSQAHRRLSPDLTPEIFPRGQPIEVKKPVTPTYDDYPEAYWELRSPTVQEPSDLKEDMIDRDRYRLQQISSLHLRAMNREVAVNRLDSYRKWQQQMQENSPRLSSSIKHDWAGGTATPAAAPVVSARSGKQQRMLLPIRNHTLAVAAKSISPSTNPAIKKQNNHAGHTSEPISDEEQHTRQKIDVAARAATEKGAQENEPKPLKASIVNLGMDQCRSNTPTSDVYMGIKKITFNAARPRSEKSRTQFYGQDQSQQQGQNQNQGHMNAHIYGPPESVSGFSNNASLGSAKSNQFQRVLSAPAPTPPSGSAFLNDEDMTEANTNTGSKLILKKFNRLQVFSEKGAGVQNTRLASHQTPWNVVEMKPTEKTPYLPQNRPPTYRLDMRNYPAGRGSSVLGTSEEDARGIVDSSGYPAVRASVEHNGLGIIPPSPDKSEATALSFRFRNGEVIVSRQGKKPNMT